MKNNLIKILLFLTLLLASGCSVLGSKRDIPEVKPIEVVTIEKQAPIYHPPLPNQIDPCQSGDESETVELLTTHLLSDG